MEDFEMSPDELEEAKEKLFKKLDEALECMEEIASDDSEDSKQRITELMHESICQIGRIYTGIGENYTEAYRFNREINPYAKKFYHCCSGNPDFYLYMTGYMVGNAVLMMEEDEEE